MLFVKCISTITQGTKTIHCIYQYICRIYFAQNSQLCKWRRFKSIFSDGLLILSLSYWFRIFRLNNASRFQARQKKKKKKKKRERREMSLLAPRADEWAVRNYALDFELFGLIE